LVSKLLSLHLEMPTPQKEASMVMRWGEMGDEKCAEEFACCES
jgi:ACT domain-containing protein